MGIDGYFFQNYPFFHGMVFGLICIFVSSIFGVLLEFILEKLAKLLDKWG